MFSLPLTWYGPAKLPGETFFRPFLGAMWNMFISPFRFATTLASAAFRQVSRIFPHVSLVSLAVSPTSLASFLASSFSFSGDDSSFSASAFFFFSAASAFSESSRKLLTCS